MAVERYRVQVDGDWIDLSVQRQGRFVVVTAGDETWETDLQRFGETNMVSLLLGTRSLEFLIEKVNDTYIIQRESEQYDVRVRPAWSAGRGGGGESAEDAELVVTCPMVGVVVEVTVAAGATVEKGDVLLVVEAMKMQNEIRAPRAGKVKATRVKVGQKVTMRQPLVVLA
jgi:biotin carboxyl carrier protein